MADQKPPRAKRWLRLGTISAVAFLGGYLTVPDLSGGATAHLRNLWLPVPHDLKNVEAHQITEYERPQCSEAEVMVRISLGTVDGYVLAAVLFWWGERLVARVRARRAEQRELDRGRT